MCGIAGYVGTRPLPEAHGRRCLDAMRRRGPDHAASYAHTPRPGRYVHLFHSRLSIIDLDPRSHQPFRRAPHVLAFNGEIYNYVELKGSLAAGGAAFDTTSDTEVLLRLLGACGPQGLASCEGMWALAFYDESDGSLLLSRDAFGEKPLYLYRDETGLYFGSEVKFIAALLGRRLRVNEGHLLRYLVNGYKALYKTPETFFEGLTELAPAGTLRLDADGAETGGAYWTPRFEPDPGLSYADAVERVREALIRAVGLRLRADVPLAFCMSGGVDSNALIGIAKNVFDYDVHGYTIVNTDSRYEEQDLVEYVVRTLDLRHTSVPVETTDFLPRLRTLVRQHDAPVYTITYYAQWLLMEHIARDGYRISLSGTGADELFSGYYDHHLAYLYEVRNDPARHRKAVEDWALRVRPYVRNPYLSDPALFVRDPAHRDHIYLKADFFAAHLVRPWHEPFTETCYTGDLLRNRMMNELFAEAVPVILHEDDLNAMYYSIENRSPFLDRALFDACYGVPTRHLIRDGYAKALLRDAVDGIVPDRVIRNHRKVGFNAPVEAFLDVADPEVKAALLDESPVFDYVDRTRIEALLGKEALPNSESKFLFYFLNSKIFLEEFAA